MLPWLKYDTCASWIRISHLTLRYSHGYRKRVTYQKMSTNSSLFVCGLGFWGFFFCFFFTSSKSSVRFHQDAMSPPIFSKLNTLRRMGHIHFLAIVAALIERPPLVPTRFSMVWIAVIKHDFQKISVSGSINVVSFSEQCRLRKRKQGLRWDLHRSGIMENLNWGFWYHVVGNQPKIIGIDLDGDVVASYKFKTRMIVISRWHFMQLFFLIFKGTCIIVIPNFP